MRFKEIKPGMVISWKTEDEKAALLEELERIGYEWYGTKRKPSDTCGDKDIGHVIHVYNDNGYKNITHSNNREEVTHNFSDLIIPDPELSAEEALLAYDQMCDENYCCNDCPIYGIVGDECTHKMDGHISEIMDAIKQWKAEHEKKKPEIEWVYRVFGAENYGERFFQTEEEAIKRCEELAKSQKTKQYARYERVCRVKAVG